MNIWEVIYTEQAETDLQGIFEYIAFSLLVPETARKQTKRIMDAVAKLNRLPLRHQLYEHEPWHSKGLRVLSVDNFLVFYLPLETQKCVAIIRIMYSGRNIAEQLRYPGMDTTPHSPRLGGST